MVKGPSGVEVTVGGWGSVEYDPEVDTDTGAMVLVLGGTAVVSILMVTA